VGRGAAGPHPDLSLLPGRRFALRNARNQLHYAGLDDRINAGIEAYKASLTKDGKDFTIYVYDGVNHAFNNDTSAARYNKEAADLAWGRMIAFFKEKLA
jgi:carboxymethylenebutenolidase